MLKFLKIINMMLIVLVAGYIVVRHQEYARLRLPLLAGDILIPLYIVIFISFFLGMLWATLLYGRSFWRLRGELKKAGSKSDESHPKRLPPQKSHDPVDSSREIAIE